MKQNRRTSGKHSKPRHPGSMMMRVAGALLCLVMLSTHLMGGLYARYRTEGSGEDEARVIKFGEIAVEETGDFVWLTPEQIRQEAALPTAFRQFWEEVDHV